MPFAALKQSAHLAVRCVSCPDEFKAIGFLEIERLALLGPYFYGRAITALPGTLMMLERTSSRNLSAMMDAMLCTVIVPMANNTGAVFNGQNWKPCEVGLLRKEISFNLREEQSNTFAIIRFSSDMQNRGWEEADGRLHLRNSSPKHLLDLQRIIRQAFTLSSTMDDRQFAIAANALRQELIDALDHVLVAQSAKKSNSRSFERYRKLVSKLDEFARAHPEMSLYSEALCEELGTSVRTLQLAVQAVHGASLHRHLRNKRLWSLRAQLAKGMAGSTVSSAAMANGFLHMGELSRLYKVTFGELPSGTLLRSRNS